MIWLDSLPKNPFSEAKSWLVVGSAGCGKSHSLRETIDDLLSSGVNASEIMYVMFNRIPSEEFRAYYLLKGYSEENLKWWGTHHSIMRRLLKVGSGCVLSAQKLVTWGAERGFHLSAAGTRTEWDKVLGSLSTKTFRKSTDHTLAERKMLAALIESEKKGIWTHFRYLAEGCRQSLFPPGVRYVFFDEAQDNGKIQMDWVEYVRNRPETEGLMLAGDDKQSINLFKGSDPKLFLDFKADRFVSLPASYRCPPEILKEANRVIKPLKTRSPLAEVSRSKVKGRVIRAPLLSCIIGQLKKDLVEGKDVLVLARDNLSAKKALSCLSSFGLNAKSENMENVRNTIAALLRIRATGKITDIDFRMVLPIPGLSTSALRQTSYWMDGVAELIGSGEFLRDTTMREAYSEARLGEGLPLADAGMLGFLPRFEKEIREWNIPPERWNLSPFEMRSFRKLAKEAVEGVGSVFVSTIHAVKGMESSSVVLLLGIPARAFRSELDNPDEERRLWYVAVTRASEKLYLTRLENRGRSTRFICT